MSSNRLGRSNAVNPAAVQQRLVELEDTAAATRTAAAEAEAAASNAQLASAAHRKQLKAQQRYTHLALIDLTPLLCAASGQACNPPQHQHVWYSCRVTFKLSPQINSFFMGVASDAAGNSSQPVRRLMQRDRSSTERSSICRQCQRRCSVCTLKRRLRRTMCMTQQVPSQRLCC